MPRFEDLTANGEALVNVAGVIDGVDIATQAELDAVAAAKADDTAVVKLTGAQTVAGVKTFSSSPVVPDATTAGQAVNKGQLDNATYRGVKVTRAANQTIPSAVFTAVEFTAEAWDDAGYHDNTVNPSRITIPTAEAGRYRVLAMVHFSAASTGRRILELRRNGTAILRDERAPTGGTTALSFTSTFDASVSDYYEVFASQTTGADLTVTAPSGAASMFFEMQKLKSA